MKLEDQFRFVRQNMKKNRTRLFMTVLATAMGCAFLIVLASVGFGLQQSVVNQVLGDGLVTEIQIWGREELDGSRPDFPYVSDADVEKFRGFDHVKAVTYRGYFGQSLEPAIAGAHVMASMVQVDFEAEQLAGFKLAHGRLPAQPNEIVIGPNIGLGEEEAVEAANLLGETMTLNVRHDAGEDAAVTVIEAVIVGVAAAPAREWAIDNSVYMGVGLRDQIEAVTGTQWGALGEFEFAAASLEEPRAYQQVKVIAERMNHVKGLADKLRAQGYLNYSVADELQQVNVIFLIMQIGLIFVGTIAVLIASIGIFNTMTMAVTERTQDIGIMKAIGAHPQTIRRLFQIESAMIGILGALIGTAVAYVISIGVNRLLPVIIKMFMDEEVPADFRFSAIPLYLAVIACAISLGVALLSGARPARRATRIDVLRALRRDL